MPVSRGSLALALLFASLVLVGTAQARNPQTAGLQVALRAHGFYKGPVDGVAGPGTARALRRFQRGVGIKCDGLAGPRTRRALGRLGRPLFGRRMIRRGMVGWDVSVLEFLLAERGLRPGKIDGRFTRGTKRALRTFQRRGQLVPDGIAGRATLAALCSARACAPVLATRAPSFTRYRVRPGDTLTAIAARHGVGLRKLARINRLDQRRVLVIGRLLRIPRRAPVHLAPVPAEAVRAAIRHWAAHYGIDPRLARALAWMESGYQVDLTSAKGAWGVMQVTPTTWAFVETVLIGKQVPRTMRGNVRVGVAYLRHLLRQFRGRERLAVAAYYQGARSVRRRGLLPITRAYVADVLALRRRL